ncbi:MAG: ankyrin repeat domain-containing protein, partial [Rhodospirillales bacterium]|nr:ankyrin repeat domain-containing protein [Rhodospirillales bacterium]
MIRRVCVTALALVLSVPLAAEELSSTTKSLFEAILRNDLAAVQVSVGRGADTSARNISGRSPVDLAVDKGHFEIAHYLLSLRSLSDDAAKGQDTAPSQSARPARSETDALAPPDPTPDLPPAPEISTLAELPPEAPTGLPPGVADPFDPAAVPMGTAHPVIERPGDQGQVAIIEPSATAMTETPEAVAEPPPAAPEETAEVARPMPREAVPKSSSTDVSEVNRLASEPNPDILNRLGNILGIGDGPEQGRDEPPPPAPDASTTEEMPSDMPFVPEIPPEVLHAVPDEAPKPLGTADRQPSPENEEAADPAVVDGPGRFRSSEIAAALETEQPLADPFDPDAVPKGTSHPVIESSTDTGMSSETARQGASVQPEADLPTEPLGETAETGPHSPNAEEMAPQPPEKPVETAATVIQEPAKISEEDDAERHQQEPEVADAEKPVEAQAEIEAESLAIDDDPVSDRADDTLAELPEESSEPQPPDEPPIEIVGEGAFSEPEMAVAPPPAPSISGPLAEPEDAMSDLGGEPSPVPEMPPEEDLSSEPPPSPAFDSPGSGVSMPFSGVAGARDITEPALTAEEAMRRGDGPIPDQTDTSPAAAEEPISVESGQPDTETDDIAASEEPFPQDPTELASPEPSESSAETGVPEDIAMADEPDGFVRSRMRQVAEELPRTFDTYLGGWFIKWVGSKMGFISEPTDEVPSGDEEQVAELSPDQAGSRTDGQPPEFEADEPTDGNERAQKTAEIEPEPEIEQDAQAQSADADATEADLVSEPASQFADRLSEETALGATTDDGGLAEAAALIVLDADPAIAETEVSDLSESIRDGKASENVETAETSEMEVGAEVEREIGSEIESEVDSLIESEAELGGPDELTAEADIDDGAGEAVGLSELDEGLIAEQIAEKAQPAEISEEDQLAELADDLPDSSADPFATDAVPPGTEHPVIGDKPIATPP